MPMYEFYCPDCNTIFTFLSKSVNTEKIPACPKCRRPDLSRMVSRFAVTGKAAKRGDNGEGGSVEGMPDLPIDESRMERAMEALASEAENIDENNPRQAADLMRKFSAMTGLKLGDKMEDALAKLEAGADPESLEAEMGDLDENDLFKLDGAGAGGAAKTLKRRAPLRDETIYDM
ncbi:MAG: zinc ribbon domain-containing protein [Chitinispirillaceae bacterium]|nr:zinc ribbon domain-containing protein [Chitinispirillaceae bacterium]